MYINSLYLSFRAKSRNHRHLNRSEFLKTIPEIYSPKVNAFAKLRSPFRFATVEMMVSTKSLPAETGKLF